MNIYIPMSPDLERNATVYNCAITQRHCGNVAYCVAGVDGKELRGDYQKRIENICLARNACLDAGAIDMAPFVILDNDCELIGDDNLIAMEAQFCSDENIVAVFLKVSDTDDHYRCGCVMYSPKFIESGFKYRYTGKCECRDMQEQVESAGYKLSFVDGKRVTNTMQHKWKQKT